MFYPCFVIRMNHTRQNKNLLEKTQLITNIYIANSCNSSPCVKATQSAHKDTREKKATIKK